MLKINKLHLIFVLFLCLVSLYALEWSNSLQPIEAKGKEVISLKYRSAGSFSEGLAPVSEDDKTFGYIDKSEKVVIPFKFKKAYPFEHGKARVQDENGNWRKIDKTGKFIE